MAPPRRKQACTPALLENLRFRFEETPESVVDIAASVPTSHTTLRDLARAQGWTKFKPPPLDLSPAARLAAEAGKLAAEAGKFAAEAGRQGAEADMSAPSFSLPPRSGGEGRLGVREHGEAGWGDASAIESGAREAPPPPPSPDPSPPLAEPVIGPAQEGRTRWFAGGGETAAPVAQGETAAPAADGETVAPMADEDAAAAPRRPWRKYEFDDEAIAELRRRYEETDETVLAIARSRGVSNTHLHRIAKEGGWVKFKPGPIGLSPAAKLNSRADALLRAKVEDGPPPLTRAELSAKARALLQSAEAHAAELEALRKQSAAAGLRPRDAHLITANIADTTAALSKLAQLCAPEPQRTSADDDQPQDIDDVRDELARRIDALVDEWLHEAAADRASGDRGGTGG